MYRGPTSTRNWYSARRRGSQERWWPDAGLSSGNQDPDSATDASRGAPRPTHRCARARDSRAQARPDLAPAGYGKTTLLAQWAHTSSFRVAWLSLDEEDNDPDRFFRYLLAAWETVHPGIRESPLGLLLGALEPDRDAVLSAFINVANDLPDHTVFVLDDVHLIEDTAIYEALTFLLDHLPPRLHFVLAGRDGRCRWPAIGPATNSWS